MRLASPQRRTRAGPTKHQEVTGGPWGRSPGTVPLAKSLNLTPGAGAVRGSYLINVTLAGGSGDWSKTGTALL